MTSLQNMPPFSKKTATGFDAAANGEKNERIARDSLRDLMLFNNALESELKHMMVEVQKGAALDHALFNKMTTAKDKYNYAMSGLKALDDQMERAAFMALADAIQDLMSYIHNRRH